MEAMWCEELGGGGQTKSTAGPFFLGNNIERVFRQKFFANTSQKTELYFGKKNRE